MVKKPVQQGSGDHGITEHRGMGTIRDRVVSHVTVSDPQHPLFGNRLAVLGDNRGVVPPFWWWDWRTGVDVRSVSRAPILLWR